MDLENFQVGIEVEIPVSDPDSDRMRSWGSKSNTLEGRLRDATPNGPSENSRSWPHGGKITSDISVGTEIVSGPLPYRLGGIPIREAVDWYARTIDTINEYGRHTPVGLINQSNQTAGLHIHFSHPDAEGARDFAHELYDVSESAEWLRVFACTSIADQNGHYTARVFRGDRHVNFDGRPGPRPNAVSRKNPSNGHYEWRVPEPMTVENFDLLMEYLIRAVDNGFTDANEWASELVYSGDSRLTSIQRARACGVDSYEPPATVDGLQVVRGASPDVHPFHNEVFNDTSMPFIFRIHTEDGRFSDTYYLIKSNIASPSDYDVPSGYEHIFPDEDVDEWLIEDTTDGGLRLADAEDAQMIFEAANRIHEDDEAAFEQSDATDVLMDAL